MTPDFRLATRRSPLALAQARAVADRIRHVHGDSVQVALVEIDSTGDLDRVSSVAALTQIGAFVRAVQAAVLDGRADAAVHSLKDLPAASPGGLVLIAFPERADPRDVVVGSTLDALRQGALVGTGSPRRAAQLRLLRPDLQTRELRGNVATRLDKVERGEVDAALLAAAGLQRLGMSEFASEVLDVEAMVPAPGQGILVVESLPEGPATELLAAIDDPDLRPLAEVERLLLAETGAGCRSALGALASRRNGMIRLHAFVEDERGPRRTEVTDEHPHDVVASARKELGL
ncbi:MAG: hydroxymethylbilane synthase [Actinomycetota bacterium]